jgi:hypothetical protein
MRIDWRSAPDMPRDRGQDGTVQAVIDGEERIIRLSIRAARPGRRARKAQGYRLAVDGQDVTFANSIQACKSVAERYLPRHITPQPFNQREKSIAEG